MCAVAHAHLLIHTCNFKRLNYLDMKVLYYYLFGWNIIAKPNVDLMFSFIEI